MTSERCRQRHADVLEFLGSGGSMGGEPQATLEAFLVLSLPSARWEDVTSTLETSRPEDSSDDR